MSGRQPGETMGNEITYKGQSVGDIARRRWLVVRQLLGGLLDYLNTAMDKSEGPGVAANVTVYADGTSPAMLPPPDVSLPPKGHFRFDRLFDDQSDTLDEIEIVDAGELYRLYAWFDYLAGRDGALELFAPLVKTLKEKSAGIR